MKVSYVISWIATATTLQAAILVTRSDKGLQFTDAVSVSVSGKDKALSLGAQPKITGSLSKLPSVRIAGTLIKDRDADTIALYEDGAAQYLVPEGASKDAPSDPAALWKSAKISYKKSQSDKTPTDVAASAFVAFLPDGLEQLTRLCTDSHLLELAGGKGKALPTQLEYIGAVATAYANMPAVAPLEKFVADSMRQRYEAFEAGTAGLDVLTQGLQYVQLSQTIYPKQPEHETLRKQLLERKAWLDRQVAILRAMAAAREWDALLLGDRDFERYMIAFPEMAALRTEALKQSEALHRQTGEERLKEDEFGAAYREFRLASMRQPSDKVLQQKVLMAWTDYSRRAAIDRQGGRKTLRSGEREVITQALRFASGYKDENKLDLALKYVLEAEAIDPDSLQVLLKKAEILGAQHEFAQAFKALDAYDLRAVDEERERASSLRNDLLFKLTSSLDDLKSQIRAAWQDGSFNKVHSLTQQGLRGKSDDAELLFQAALSALIIRDPKESKADFAHYLEFSNTLDANADERARARALANTITDAAPAKEEGDVNWLSGKRLPKGVIYCPASLAFQPHVDHVEASGKLKETFEWDGDRLRSITPTFDKSEHATGEKRITFAYDRRVPQVNAVAADADAAAPTATDPDDLYKHSSLVLSNNPYVDPAAVQRLTGKNISLGIAGNRYFNPFVWDRIHYFRLTYDTNGRVSQAREIASPTAPAGNSLLEFSWNGPVLVAISGYEGSDGNRGAKTYERTMQYEDGRLVSEEIQSQGKTSKIVYKYSDGKLVSATCDRDATLDDRSRQVTFR